MYYWLITFILYALIHSVSPEASLEWFDEN